MKVTYTDEALADIVDAIAYPTAAAKLDADIARCVERLAHRDFKRAVSRLRSNAVARAFSPFRSYGHVAAALHSRGLHSSRELRSASDLTWYAALQMPRRTIVRIGSSRGIWIPKKLLDEAKLPGEIELRVEPGRLIVQAARHPRAGWAVAAKRIRARGENGLLDR